MAASDTKFSVNAMVNPAFTVKAGEQFKGDPRLDDGLNAAFNARAQSQNIAAMNDAVKQAKQPIESKVALADDTALAAKVNEAIKDMPVRNLAGSKQGAEIV